MRRMGGFLRSTLYGLYVELLVIETLLHNFQIG